MYSLGVDVGSTSANLVLMDENKKIISYRYLKTYGTPIEVIKKALRSFKNEFRNNLNVIAVAVTGSGRYMTAKSIGADLVKYSIVNNYLNRVVGQKKIGKKVFLQGGIAYNQGVINAFRVLTGKNRMNEQVFNDEKLLI